MSWGLNLMEQGWLPDWLIRLGIRNLLKQRLAARDLGNVELNRQAWQEWVNELGQSPIAINTRDANQQHYELPPEFFLQVLGPRLKYSSCYWPKGVDSLADAENEMLKLSCERTNIQHGQRVLDLGCGWGSLSLYIAEKYPTCQITSVSNSAPQRMFIEQHCKEQGYKQIQVITADMNDFEAEGAFDRIVSIEMFEHLRNYNLFFKKLSQWLKPEGLLFTHIFVHHSFAYPFDTVGQADRDWMTEHFFSGGQMPSDDLLLHFQEDLSIRGHWNVNGKHYARTLNAWLKLMDDNIKDVLPILESTYGDEASIWRRRWRVFFMACAELFAYKQGNEWFVSHYLFKKR